MRRSSFGCFLTDHRPVIRRRFSNASRASLFASKCYSAERFISSMFMLLSLFSFIYLPRRKIEHIKAAHTCCNISIPVRWCAPFM